jgi:ABC-type transport system substrate-binding protein
MPLQSALRQSISRRNYLRSTSGLATLAATGLAGCGSSDTDGGPGAWYTPDGDRLTIDITAPANGTWPLNCQTAAATLSAFGIESSPVLRESAAYGDDVQNSDFTMAINVWGGATTSHPFSFFSQAFSQDRATVGNFDPTAMDVPMPVGDPRGSIETVDVTETIAALGEAKPEEERDIVRKLAWIYNQTLPRLPLMSGVARRWLNGAKWDYPDKDSEYMRDNPVNTVLSHAKVTAKPDSDDRTFQIATSNANPTDIQWNPYFLQANKRSPTAFMFERLFNNQAPPNDVDPANVPERTPLLGENVEFDDGTMSVRMRDDRVWTDGDPVTAADLAVNRRLQKYLGQSSGEVWDSLSVVDDYTVEFDIADRNPELVSAILLSGTIEVKRGTQFAAWVESFEETTTDEERKSLRREIVQTRVDEYESYGVWKIEDISTGRFLLTPHEAHPLSGELTFDALELVSLPNNQTRW